MKKCRRFQEVIEKLRKLLRLATDKGATRGEADMQKAQKLAHAEEQFPHCRDCRLRAEEGMRRFLWLLAVLGFATSLKAAADFAEVRPGTQKSSPLFFEIRFDRLGSGDTQFTIRVSENVDSQSRFLKFPEHFTTYLGTAKIIDYSPEEQRKNLGGMVRSESYQSLRKVDSGRKDNVITCVFTVTEKELADPDFCFFIAEVPDKPIPGFTAWFARLHKFVKRVSADYH